MKQLVRRYNVANTLLFGFASFLLWHVIRIGKDGAVTITESHVWLLYVDLFFLLAVIVFAILNITWLGRRL